MVKSQMISIQGYLYRCALNVFTFCVRQSGERILFESFQISPAGIDRDAMRFQGLGAILLWLAHLVSIPWRGGGGGTPRNSRKGCAARFPKP